MAVCVGGTEFAAWTVTSLAVGVHGGRGLGFGAAVPAISANDRRGVTVVGVEEVAMLVIDDASASVYRLEALSYVVVFHKLLLWRELLSGMASAFLQFSTVPCSLTLFSALSSLDLSSSCVLVALGGAADFALAAQCV